MKRKNIMIKVSVIIPIYNDEDFLKICLESVVQQSLKDIEIICINDGSTDHTGLILEEYRKMWKNIVVYTQENQGVSFSRNKGIQLARGEYVAFMDGDDYYPDNEVLECLYETAKKEHVAICGGSCVLDRGGVIQRFSDHLQYFENAGRISFDDYAFPFGFTRFIYSKELLWKENIKFPLIRQFEDPPFLMLAMIRAQEFYAINKIVYCYRIAIHENTYSYEDAINALMAMKEMLFLAQKCHSINLQIRCMEFLRQRFIKNVLPYYNSDDERILFLLEEIQACVMEDVRIQIPNTEKFFTSQGIEMYISESEREFWLFQNSINNNQKVIIYGAGMVGKFVMELMEATCLREPIGIAVTQLRKIPQYLKGMEITDIRNWGAYKEDALFIVAVMGEKQQDMLHILKTMEVKNIYVVDYLKLFCYARRKEIAKNRELGRNDFLREN